MSAFANGLLAYSVGGYVDLVGPVTPRQGEQLPAPASAGYVDLVGVVTSRRGC